ncbi:MULTISPECIES: AAA family ATPase [Bacillus cereus group]|uniref:Endonuclease GajA/Old nuclease/RecF-like AAA domain-containing protein n=1 Tax=Bacillus mycoides TaxID=1405 RepID=A0A1D3MP05_BACMY|nr:MULTISPECIES: AAA family ATPase [Bacillus cereus group]OFD90590.1 hypothetical protein BWGOE11_33930 [Bacillus mycoides]OFD96877.1 hypothetical protein BWGOE13_33680 [Bacillus mycoides]OHX28475.1 hypothetical protein BWGOE5_56100 [Bacillus mycoides]WJE17745.1 AAA family ATPase [Bacillus cereus]SCM87696.1 Uncharacterized protein BWAI21_03136 [Bacillus mycoides]
MKLAIRNVGLVREADIKLEGLTVIAGENDTGKSTVGKSIFSIIKGVNSHHKDFKDAKFSQIEDIIDDIYFKVREISRNFSGDRLIGAASGIYPPFIRKDLLRYLNLEDFEGLEEYVHIYKENVESELDKFGMSCKEPIDAVMELDSLLYKLDETVLESQNPKKFVIDTIMLALKSEFGTDICNKYENDLTTILYDENGELVFESELFNEEIQHAIYSGGPLEIEDVTYIESPLIFQMHKMISEANIFSTDSKLSLRIKNKNKNRKNSIPFHMKDLISKMSDSTYYDLGLENENQQFIDEISAIIEGESILDKDSDDFLFEREWDNQVYSFKTSNVASGIKSFSMIQMLLKAQVINERTILIIDEPEIHLHPKWQIKYCEIIVKLASLGVKVVVTSHSPYIIQALKVLANKFEINTKVNFYLAEKESQSASTKIINVNDDLNSVFKKLSDPLQKLIWEK